MTSANFQEAINTLQKRAATDDQFRELAKTDAHAALAEIGANLPSDAKIKFVEVSEGITISFAPRAGSEGELSDNDLENASGGAQGYTMIPSMC